MKERITTILAYSTIKMPPVPQSTRHIHTAQDTRKCFDREETMGTQAPLESSGCAASLDTRTVQLEFEARKGREMVRER